MMSSKERLNSPQFVGSQRMNPHAEEEKKQKEALPF